MGVAGGGARGGNYICYNFVVCLFVRVSSKQALPTPQNDSLNLCSGVGVSRVG